MNSEILKVVRHFQTSERFVLKLTDSIGYERHKFASFRKQFPSESEL